MTLRSSLRSEMESYDVDLATDEFRRLATPELMAQWAVRAPFRAIRGTVPVVVCARLEDVKAIFQDADRFTVETPDAPGLETFEQFGKLENLLQMDGARHTRARALINPAFSPKSINALQSAVEALVETKLDVIAKNGPNFDIMSSYSADLIRLILLDATLKLTIEQQAVFQRMHNSFSLVSEFRPGEPWPTEFVASIEAVRAVVQSIVHERRGGGATDFISTLVNTQIDGDQLKDEEIFGHIIAICAGALGSTAGAIGMAMWLLCRHPDQLALLKTAKEECLSRAIEECLRYRSAGVFAFVRFATANVEVGGMIIPQHSPVLLSTMAANFDSRQFPDPLRFDITRDARRNQTFGTGSHHCIGSQLARMVMRVAIGRLVDRFPDVHLADPAFEPSFAGLPGELFPVSIPMRTH